MRQELVNFNDLYSLYKKVRYKSSVKHDSNLLKSILSSIIVRLNITAVEEGSTTLKLAVDSASNTLSSLPEGEMTQTCIDILKVSIETLIENYIYFIFDTKMDEPFEYEEDMHKTLMLMSNIYLTGRL